MKTQSQIDIIVPFYNQYSLVSRCLKSVAGAGYQHDRLILVDDGSEPSVREQVEALCAKLNVDTMLLSHRKNRGFHASILTGVQACQSPYVILLNSDTVVTPDFAPLLVEVMEANRSIKAVAPVSNHPTDLYQFRNELEEAVGLRTERELVLSVGRLALQRRQQYFSKIRLTPYLTAMCLALDRKAFEEAGYLSNLYQQGYFEDLDLCCKLRDRGYQLAIREDCFVFHTGHGTYRDKPPHETTQIIQQNFNTFSHRWNHLPEHPDLLKRIDLVDRYIPSTSQAAANQFDIFVRTTQTDSGRWQEVTAMREVTAMQEVTAMREVASCTRYSLRQPFSEVCAQFSKTKAPFLMLVDEDIPLTPEQIRHCWKSIALSHSNRSSVLSEDRSIPGEKASTLSDHSSSSNGVGFTIQCAGFTKIFGASSSFPRHLPGWFCVLNRTFFEQHAESLTAYASLDFFLFELSKRHSARWSFLSQVDLQVDWEKWVTRFVLPNAIHLASDYQIYQQRGMSAESNECNSNPSSEPGSIVSIKPGSVQSKDADSNPSSEPDSIPCQFRIERIGNYIPVPSKVPIVSKSDAQPRFSVICPAYKSIYFDSMMRSIVEQTWTDWELVVVIDGPPPEEEQQIRSILQRHQTDPRIRHYHQENQGTGPTRQRLVELAKGDFILSIDDDDMLTTSCLETFAHAIQQHPAVSVFRGGTQLVGLVNRYLPPRPRLRVNGISNDLFEVNQPYVMKRETVDRLGGFEGDGCFREAGEDSDFFLKVDKTPLQVAIIDHPLYFRRISTRNQILSITPIEALDHVKSLIHKHRPQEWELMDLQFESEGAFVHQTTTFRHPHAHEHVICSSRFFNYRTLGEQESIDLDLEVTSACNAVCLFCPRDRMENTNQHLSWEVVERLSHYLQQEQARRKINLCGIGEPTLYPQLEATIRLLSKTSTVAMTTNGSRLTKPLFQRLVDHGLAELNISLNATQTETHQQLMAIKNFSKIKKHVLDILALREQSRPDIKIHVSFVVCQQNVHEAEAFVEEWKAYPVDKIWIHPLNNRAGWISPQAQFVDIAPYAEKFADDPRVMVDVFHPIAHDGKVCKVAQSMDFISVDGTLRLCAMDYARQTQFGHLNTVDLQQMHVNKIKNYLDGNTSTLCQNCDFYPERNVETSTPRPL